ncbi:hypothetical protein P170DRAFT_501745 [Aspergillus steynii IBT 23096]|uniref:Uncharacterized protein n=1 Tax=Aspergillus steynii IBT 23096 TaxID=1392250 RepID=A0A2I2FW40_9EURO|nr:uncharacterized protein P170DRAFT_501745 [Aspergillus steynii IBT 23096]PLB44851.1 hypothetical protein P170DRAFT_501745 [Aspergillus steynii IBT 23096]
MVSNSHTQRTSKDTTNQAEDGCLSHSSGRQILVSGSTGFSYLTPKSRTQTFAEPPILVLTNLFVKRNVQKTSIMHWFRIGFSSGVPRSSGAHYEDEDKYLRLAVLLSAGSLLWIIMINQKTQKSPIRHRIKHQNGYRPFCSATVVVTYPKPSSLHPECITWYHGTRSMRTLPPVEQDIIIRCYRLSSFSSISGFRRWIPDHRILSVLHLPTTTNDAIPAIEKLTGRVN